VFLRELADAEPFVCAGIDFGMLLPRDVSGSCEVVLEVLKPGQQTSFDLHESFDQVFFTLAGSGELTLADETSSIGPHTLAFVPMNTLHSVRCTSQHGLSYLYINVWNSRIPDAEQDWKDVYSRIHQRRTLQNETPT
jgi:mannose-6-phosphate isomerase-like protein (cupin superfamily)